MPLVKCRRQLRRREFNSTLLLKAHEATGEIKKEFVVPIYRLGPTGERQVFDRSDFVRLPEKGRLKTSLFLGFLCLFCLIRVFRLIC